LPDAECPFSILGTHRAVVSKRFASRRVRAFVRGARRQGTNEPLREAALLGQHDMCLGREEWKNEMPAATAISSTVTLANQGAMKVRSSRARSRRR